MLNCKQALSPGALTMKPTRKHLLCALLLASCTVMPRLACAGRIDVAAALPGPPQASAARADGAGQRSEGVGAFVKDDGAAARDAPGMAFAPMPEPGSVAIMAAGLGLAGFVVRRRRSGRPRES
jgi:hypothetical protein